jgi:hypothetical protein
MTWLRILRSLLVGSTADPSGRNDEGCGPWVTFQSPAGFYSVQYPVARQVDVEGNIVNIVTPDRGGAVTFSAYHADREDPEIPGDLLRKTFTVEVPTSEVLEVSYGNSLCREQTFLDPVNDRALIAVVACRHPIYVLVTANDSTKEMLRRVSIYRRIIESIWLGPPR